MLRTEQSVKVSNTDRILQRAAGLEVTKARLPKPTKTGKEINIYERYKQQH